MEFNYTHFFISTWTLWQKPSLSTYCANFFRQKPSCAMCLIFFEKKSLHVLIQPSELHVKTLMCLIMCLFFSTKAFMCHVINFFWKKKPSCAYLAKWITLNFLAKAFVLAKLCLWCAYLFRQKPSCAMCFIFSKKKAFMCLIGHVLIKKWVYIHLKVCKILTSMWSSIFSWERYVSLLRWVGSFKYWISDYFAILFSRAVCIYRK